MHIYHSMSEEAYTSMEYTTNHDLLILEADNTLENIRSIFYTILRTVILLATFVGNGLTIIAFARITSLRRVSNYFIFSLSLADLLSGVLTMLMMTSFWEVGKCGFITVGVVRSTIHVPVMVSMFHVLLISIDRYIYFAYPLKYDIIMTPNRAIIIIICIWVGIGFLCYAILFLYIGHEECFWLGELYFTYTRSIEAAMFLSALILMSILYVKIILIIMKQRRRIINVNSINMEMNTIQQSTGLKMSHPTTSSEYEINKLSSMNLDNNKSTTRMNRKSSQSYRPILMLLVLILAMLILWLPYMISIIIPLDEENGQTLRDDLATFGFLNSAVNTFIYATMSREFKEAYRVVLTCKSTN